MVSFWSCISTLRVKFNTFRIPRKCYFRAIFDVWSLIYCQDCSIGERHKEGKNSAEGEVIVIAEFNFLVGNKTKTEIKNYIRASMKINSPLEYSPCVRTMVNLRECMGIT